MKIILASSSPYRRELLQRLMIEFESCSPDIDENIRSGETPPQLVQRLAESKARKAALEFSNALIIGADQVAVHGDEIIGKPRNHAQAMNQLTSASGQIITLYTGLALLNSALDRIHSDVIPFRVHFRQLSPEQIKNYLQKERPYDCAGSLKSEGLGIALLQRMEGDDPNTLIGLPLIRLVEMLNSEGVEII